jgi:biopolymer transport protein ExbD
MYYAMTPLRTRTLTRARIEIIPLIDVIFFLLATFVLFTLSLNKIRNIELTLPDAGIEKSPHIPDPVILSVTANGAIFWDGIPTEPAILRTRLDLLREGNPDPRVLIAGDVHASYGAAIDVLDTVRAAGIEKVSIETRVRPVGR